MFSLILFLLSHFAEVAKQFSKLVAALLQRCKLQCNIALQQCNVVTVQRGAVQLQWSGTTITLVITLGGGITAPREMPCCAQQLHRQKTATNKETC